MKQIVRQRFGSHLYGTSTPESDEDFKSVFIPDGRDILLQRAKGSINNQRPKGDGEKNYAGEVDEERFSLQRFLQLAAEGQTVALDMLFAPDWALTEEPSSLWRQIQENRHRLLTKKSKSFIGYARTQANRYGIRGSRVAAARAALTLLDNEPLQNAKLGSMSPYIHDLIANHEHMSIVKDVTPHGQEVLLWNVCDRKMPFTASVKNARDIMQRVVDEYGKRALMAETQQGVDWKALSHAVRVGHQAIELLSTGFVTFPLPNATHVKAIKQGRLLYQDVAAEIEELLVKVEETAAVSVLPDEPDYEWIDDFVANAYREEVLSS
jgi:hypothetical protein